MVADNLYPEGRPTEVPRRVRRQSRVTLKQLYRNFPYEVWKYNPVPPQPVRLKKLRVIASGYALYVSAKVKSATSNRWYTTTLVLWRKNKSEKWSWDMKAQFKCSCDAYKYYLAFALYSHGAIVGRPSFWNKVPAVVRNPENKPQLCKHGVLLVNHLIRKGIIKGSMLWNMRRANSSKRQRRKGSNK